MCCSVCVAVCALQCACCSVCVAVHALQCVCVCCCVCSCVCVAVYVCLENSFCVCFRRVCQCSYQCAAICAVHCVRCLKNSFCVHRRCVSTSHLRFTNSMSQLHITNSLSHTTHSHHTLTALCLNALTTYLIYKTYQEHRSVYLLVIHKRYPKISSS